MIEKDPSRRNSLVTRSPARSVERSEKEQIVYDIWIREKIIIEKLEVALQHQRNELKAAKIMTVINYETDEEELSEK